MSKRLMITLLALAPSAVFSAAHAADLTIWIEGVRSAAGTVDIALFARGTRFPDPASAHKLQRVTARRGTVTASFSGLASGQYAVALFHDENGNRKLDTNLLGVPKEGVGFSNNVRAVLGPPSFAQTQFPVGQSAVTQSIRLRY